MARFQDYKPEYDLSVDGEPIPPSLRAAITSISFQNGLEGADRVEIGLANEELRWMDHPLLNPGNEVALSIGYAPDPLAEVFVGEITGVEASFSGGMCSMSVTAHDFMQRMTASTKDLAYALDIPCIGRFPLPDPAIAALVGASNLLVPVIDPAGAAVSFFTLLMAYAIDPLDAKNAIRVQRGESDFDFLSNLAKENGWEMFIDHTMEPKGYALRFLFPIPEYSPVASLKWGESLMDFSPRISNVGQVMGVSTRLYISSIKTELVLELGWDYDRAGFDLKIYPSQSGIEAAAGGGKNDRLKIESFGPLTAPKQILSELLPRLNNRQTCSGSTVGNPKIMASKILNFEGVGSQFSGLYRVTSATHTLDGSGYRTQFEARKEIWFGSVPVPKGASGLARVNGITLT